MTEDAREINDEELDDVAGGLNGDYVIVGGQKVLIPAQPMYLRKLIKETFANGGSIDTVLAKCKTDGQRDFVRRQWDWYMEG